VRKGIIKPLLCLRKRHLTAELIDKRKEFGAQRRPLVETVKIYRLHISIKALRP
jgi:hypothetical protein